MSEWGGCLWGQSPAGRLHMLLPSVLQAWGRFWRWWGRFQICHPACLWPTTHACWPLSSSISSMTTCAVTRSAITFARSVRSTSREFPVGLTGSASILVISYWWLCNKLSQSITIIYNNMTVIWKWLSWAVLALGFSWSYNHMLAPAAVSHLKVWLGLEDLVPWWYVHWLAHWCWLLVGGLDSSLCGPLLMVEGFP